MSTLLSAALSLARIGIRVVPMHSAVNGKCTCRDPACSRPAKHPRVSGGVKAASNDLAQVRAWWKIWPTANIGIATGKGSGVIVLDLDPRNGGKETMAKCRKELGPLPLTAKVHTGGGGFHWLFKAPAKPIKSDTAGKNLGSGLDVLAEGRIAIAPPSVHKTGKRYQPVKGRNLLKGAKLLPLPKPWRERMSRGPTVGPKPASEKKAVVVRGGNQTIIPEGQRNNTLLSLGGKLIRAGFSPEAVVQALLEENKACRPPYTEAEVREVAARAESYRNTDDMLDHADPGASFMKMVLRQNYADGAHLIFTEGMGFYEWSGTHWQEVPRSKVATQVMDIVQSVPSSARPKTDTMVREVMRLLEIDRSRDAAKLDLTGALDRPSVINCRNCELWLDRNGKVTVKPHSPTSYLTNVLNVDYDPAATSPEYDEALLKIFQKAENPKAMRRHWNELFGYILQPRRDIKLIVMLLGGGDNGKSKLMELIADEFLGINNYVSARVGELEGNQFSLSKLVGKLLFYDDDVQSGTKLADGILKKISEERAITTEKKYQNSFTFRCRALPVLLCNNLPTTSDVSPALHRRIMAIPFDHQFKPGIDLDPDLFERIRQNELSGVLNQALEGLQRLRARGHFKKPSDVQRKADEWFKNANPVEGFLADMCQPDPTAKWRQQDAYDRFQEYCKDNGYTIVMQLKTFVEKLNQRGYETKRTRVGKMVFGLKEKEAIEKF
jgi:P4 family phage/plasmid primase-like protien